MWYNHSVGKKRRVGRPSLRPGKRLDKHVGFTVTREQHRELVALAKTEGKTLTSFLRDLALETLEKGERET